MPYINERIKNKQLRNILESIFLSVILTGLSYAVGVAMGWISLTTLNWLEVFAVFVSYASVYLCVMERRFNYPVGVIASAAYALLFLQSGLLASAVLNAYLVPTLVYGWFRWRKDTQTRPVTHVRLKMIPLYILIAGLGYGGASLFSSSLGGALAWTDSIILIGTILAQFLLDNKKLENWIIWAVVDIFAIYTYMMAGLPLVAFQYVLFLGNTIYGYIMWKRSMNHGKYLCTDDSDATNDRSLAADTIR